MFRRLDTCGYGLQHTARAHTQRLWIGGMVERHTPRRIQKIQKWKRASFYMFRTCCIVHQGTWKGGTESHWGCFHSVARSVWLFLWLCLDLPIPRDCSRTDAICLAHCVGSQFLSRRREETTSAIKLQLDLLNSNFVHFHFFLSLFFFVLWRMQTINRNGKTFHHGFVFVKNVCVSFIRVCRVGGTLIFVLFPCGCNRIRPRSQNQHPTPQIHWPQVYLPYPCRRFRRHGPSVNSCKESHGWTLPFRTKTQKDSWVPKKQMLLFFVDGCSACCFRSLEEPLVLVHIHWHIHWHSLTLKRTSLLILFCFVLCVLFFFS